MLTPYIKTAVHVPDGLYVFPKTLSVKTAGAYTVNLFTTGRYPLKINGRYISEDSCKGHEGVRYYDTVSVQLEQGDATVEITVLHDYLEYSADLDFAKQFCGTMDKLLWFFENHLSEDGLIEKSIWWDFADWVPGWKQGEQVSDPGMPITLYNLYYACALKKAADICRRLGRSGLAAEYRDRYERTAASIRANCLDADGYYCDSKAGSAKSVHCAIWAILSGLENASYGRKLLDTLGNPAFGQPSFCMTFYLFRALELCGMADKIFTLTGVCDLAWAKGTVPTRYDVVTVDRDENAIRILAPAGVVKQVILPNGKAECFTAHSAEFSW